MSEHDQNQEISNGGKEIVHSQRRLPLLGNLLGVTFGDVDAERCRRAVQLAPRPSPSRSRSQWSCSSAIDRPLRIQQRRARLLGLDPPSKHAIRATSASDFLRGSALPGDSSREDKRRRSW